MRNLFLYMLPILFLFAGGKVWAQLQSSTAADPQWYFIQFMNGSEVLIPKDEDQEIQPQLLSGNTSEYWRFYV